MAGWRRKKWSPFSSSTLPSCRPLYGLLLPLFVFVLLLVLTRSSSALYPVDTSQMIHIPGGWFIMGDSTVYGERPAHLVYIEAFYIDQYEVTNARYKKFCNVTGRAYPPNPGWGGEYTDYFMSKPNYPVVNISWDEAVAYAKWEGKRLPTEAEWEKAARGEDARSYPWGNDWDGAHLNFADSHTAYPWRDPTTNDGYAYTAPVGSYAAGASPYGVMDMSGNVQEWVADWYQRDYYTHSPRSNPRGPVLDASNIRYLIHRVVRGGSWSYPDAQQRTTSRQFQTPGARFGDVGFRCVVSAKDVRS